MGEFILSTLVVLIMLAEKLFFFNLEKGYSKTVWGVADLMVLILLFIVGLIAFTKDFSKLRRQRKNRVKQKPGLPAIIFLIAAGLVVAITFYLNSMKISLNWDAVALYDARAKFLTYGLKFSEMPSLSQSDNLNKYYYLLYPPYTSIAHFFWYKTALFSGVPVGVYYSITLALLVSIVFLVVKKSIGMTGGALLAFLIVSNGSIFNIAMKEYTNLPFALHLVVGIFFLFSYLKTRRLWSLIYGTFLVSTSIWIRLLEPIWIAVIVAFGLAIFFRKDLIKKILPVAALALCCLLQYFSWAYFTKAIGHNPTAIVISTPGLFEPFLGILTGAFYKVFAVFAKSWGIPLFIHLVTLLSLGLRWRYVIKNKDVLFLGLILLFSILLYFCEIYVLSFQVDWWDIITKSLDRSSAFLIPISGYLLIRLIRDSTVLKPPRHQKAR